MPLPLLFLTLKMTALSPFYISISFFLFVSRKDDSYVRSTPPRKFVHSGSAILAVVIVLAIMTSMMGLASAKMSQASLSSTSTNQIATKANSIANSDAELVRATAYNDLSAKTRQAVPDTGFQHEVTLGNESDYSKGIKQRTVTILVYKGNESTPRVSLPVTRYSTEKEFSGVPIGTVIAWAGSKAPTTNGTWLECNGQSCAAYPALTAILGKSTVPDYRGRFLESDTTPGTVKEAGLPNITGWFTGYDNGSPLSGLGQECSGSFWKIRENWVHVYPDCTVLTFDPTGSIAGDLRQIENAARRAGVTGYFAEAEGIYDFSASRSSSIYGNSTTVQPASVTVRRFIKAA